MTRNVGLWIDHKHAFIFWQDKEDVLEIPSNVEPRVPFSGGSRIGGLYNQNLGKEQRFYDRFENQLREFYEKVIAALRSAEHIYIMGPGEAKIELEKLLLQHKELRDRLLTVETVDKMTKHQMAAHARNFFTHALEA